MKGLVAKTFSEDDITQITEATGRAEARTSGEIRVCLRNKFERGVNNEDEQALRDFVKHGLHETEGNTGVLILVVMKQKRLRILGDTAINDLLGQDYWTAQAMILSDHFGSGRFVEGVCTVVEDVGRRLAEHFPIKEGDKDELSNKPIVEDED